MISDAFKDASGTRGRSGEEARARSGGEKVTPGERGLHFSSRKVNREMNRPSVARVKWLKRHPSPPTENRAKMMI
jgi:hypothetical protein